MPIHWRVAAWMGVWRVAAGRALKAAHESRQ